MVEKPSVVVLGGAGAWGSEVVKECVQSQAFSKISIGDKNIEKAERIVAELGDKVNMVAHCVDVEDPPRLVKVMEESDVVINMVAPYTKYCSAVVKAAIEAKRNYVDIMDRWATTVDIFDLDESAREAGVTILINLGVDPGVVNVLAKHGAVQMDQAEEVHISYLSVPSHISSVQAWRSRMAALSEDVPAYKDGKLIKVPVFTPNMQREFAGPEGTIIGEVHSTSHPQTFTIPRFIKGVQTVTTSGGRLPRKVEQALRFFSEYGLLSSASIRIGDSTFTALDLAAAICASDVMAKAIRILGTESFSIFRTEVKGEKQGKPARYVYTHFAKTSTLSVAAPPVIGAKLLARGEIQQKGVIAPETLDSKPLITEFLEGGIAFRTYES